LTGISNDNGEANSLFAAAWELHYGTALGYLDADDVGQADEGNETGCRLDDADLRYRPITPMSEG
jgi:hypothetical protein